MHYNETWVLGAPAANALSGVVGWQHLLYSVSGGFLQRFAGCILAWDAAFSKDRVTRPLASGTDDPRIAGRSAMIRHGRLCTYRTQGEAPAGTCLCRMPCHHIAITYMSIRGGGRDRATYRQMPNRLFLYWRPDREFGVGKVRDGWWFCGLLLLEYACYT